MKKILSHPITYCLLFITCIGILSSYQTKENPPAPFVKPIPRIVLSLPDADTALVQLSTVYEIIDKIDCLSQGDGRIAKRALVAIMNKIQIRIDTTGKK